MGENQETGGRETGKAEAEGGDVHIHWSSSRPRKRAEERDGRVMMGGVVRVPLARKRRRVEGEHGRRMEEEGEVERKDEYAAHAASATSMYGREGLEEDEESGRRESVVEKTWLGRMWGPPMNWRVIVAVCSACSASAWRVVVRRVRSSRVRMCFIVCVCVCGGVGSGVEWGGPGGGDGWQ